MRGSSGLAHNVGGECVDGKHKVVIAWEWPRTKSQMTNNDIVKMFERLGLSDYIYYEYSFDDGNKGD